MAKLSGGSSTFRPALGYLLLVPTFLVTVLFVRLAPYLVRQPDLRLIPELFIPATARYCAPKVAEVAAYVASVFTPPIVFYGFCRWVKSDLARARGALGRYIAHTNRPAVVTIGLLQIGFVFFLLQNWFSQLKVERVFSDYEVLTAAGLMVAVLIVSFSQPVMGWLRRIPFQNGFSLGVALVLIGMYSLPTVYTEANLPLAHQLVLDHYHHWVGEFEAILLGKTPLVDVFLQYTNLLGLLVLPVFKIFGIGVLSFTLTLTVLSAVGLLCIYFALRSFTDGPLVTLALFVAFLGISEYLPISGAFQYHALWPIRGFGPAVAVYFLSRYLLRPSRSRAVMMFIFASLAALNNLDFGLPAYVGVLAAYLGTAGASAFPPRAMIRRLIGPPVIAGIAVLAGFTLLCWIRGGRLPDFKYLYFYQRIFGIYGFFSVPTPYHGLHRIMYLSYIGAVLWAIYLLEFGEDRRSAGMLLFCGIYGAGSFMYYANRSLPPVMEGLFPIWGLCFVVLFWTLYRFARDAYCRSPVLPFRWVYPVPVACFAFAYGLCLVNLAKMPTLGQEWERFQLHDPSISNRREAMTQYLWAHTVPNEPVALLVRYPNGVLEAAHVEDVVPVPHPGAIFFKSQVRETMDAILKRGVKKVFGEEQYLVDFAEMLRGSGFALKETVNLENAPGPLEFWERP